MDMDVGKEMDYGRKQTMEGRIGRWKEDMDYGKKKQNKEGGDELGKEEMNKGRRR